MQSIFLSLALMLMLAIPPSIDGQTTSPTSGLRALVGTIVQVEGSELVIRYRWEQDGQTTTRVRIDRAAHVYVDLDRRMFADLANGMEVTILERPAPSEESGTRVTVHAWSPSIRGEVMDVDDTKLVLRPDSTTNQNEPKTIALSPATVVVLPERPGAFVPGEGEASIDVLRPGMSVRIIPAEGAPRKILVTNRGSTPATTQSVGKRLQQNGGRP